MGHVLSSRGGLLGSDSSQRGMDRRKAGAGIAEELDAEADQHHGAQERHKLQFIETGNY